MIVSALQSVLFLWSTASPLCLFPQRANTFCVAASLLCLVVSSPWEWVTCMRNYDQFKGALFKKQSKLQAFRGPPPAPLPKSCWWKPVARGFYVFLCVSKEEAHLIGWVVYQWSIQSESIRGRISGCPEMGKMYTTDATSEDDLACVTLSLLSRENTSAL